MSTTVLRLGIVGCGTAARAHLHRLRGLPEVRLVGCADPDAASARALAGLVAPVDGEPEPGIYADHRELIRDAKPDVLAIFTPHLLHYRPAMDALQAGCHVFIEKPLSTNVQEAVDIVGLARGRGRKVGVGHQFRLCPSLVEARRLLAEGAIGRLHLVTATLARPWLAAQTGAEHSWRFDPKLSGGGVLADVGDHLLDALLWTTRSVATEVAAIQARSEAGLETVTAAALRLTGGVPAMIGVSGVTPGSTFELCYYGDEGWLRATDVGLDSDSGRRVAVQPLPQAAESIDGNFVSAVLRDTPLCCSAEEALDTVRLLEAIGRSVATGQLVRLA